MKKYLIRNLDCAMCAAKIETALNKTPGVNRAILDFSTQTLHLDATDTQRAIQAAKKIDPAVEIVPVSLSHSETRETDFNAKNKLTQLAVAGVLFVIVLLMEYGSILQVPENIYKATALLTYLFAGRTVFLSAFRTISNKQFFDENTLMVIATAGALAIGAFSEAVGVMIFYMAGEFLQNLAVNRSRGSIRALLAQKPDHASLQTDDGIKHVPPETVGPGEYIIVKPGEKIPLDGKVISGASQVDTSVLTGESVPKAIGPDDEVLAGEINMTGAITVEVTRPYDQSSIARMLELVENASARKAGTENFITVFARYYTPAIVIAAACIAFIPPLFIPGAFFRDWIYRALVLLVISCPCALVISIPLGYFGGIGRASASGILVKGSNYIDALAGLKTVVFDKTGTLTEGVFEVKDVVAENGYSPAQILEFAAIAEQNSNHPIARSIISAFEKKNKLPGSTGTDSHEEISGAGVKTVIDGTYLIVGSQRLLKQEGIAAGIYPVEGTVVHVAVNKQYAGYILIGDRIKPDARKAISALRKNGVEKVMMLTGDNQKAADHLASQLDIDDYYSDLLPEDKVSIFEQIQAEQGKNGKIAFVGDGINDAPVIARADVGVAMGALGSDAAIETADVVLMSDSPSRMAQAVAIGKKTRTIVWQNIFLALFIKAVVIAFGILGLATMWAAVFADVGTALLAVVNSTRALKRRKRPGKDANIHRGL
jgi:Cd2+/Zn2+-exporting ATPase